jgi:iron complex transport system ATP-binding protein
MLAAHGLSLRLGTTPALHDVAAELRRGEITAICGPNGAGKSTLLSCLAGLLTPDKGVVTLDGSPLAGMALNSRAQAIGYLPQHGAIAWDLSVRNLVALGRLPHGDAAAGGAEAVERALAALDLAAVADRPASRLSGGERARALFGRVLAGEPRWILADEPLAALDLAHQLAMLARLREAARLGAGVVLVLHDLTLAMNHADRVLVLSNGKLSKDGPPEQALARSAIREVWNVDAQWLGEPGAQALSTF